MGSCLGSDDLNVGPAHGFLSAQRACSIRSHLLKLPPHILAARHVLHIRQACQEYCV